MAGEWLKFDCSLPEKPEVLAITAAMGWDDPDLTVGKLMRVFRWFDQHTIGGNAAGVTSALLDRVVGVAGLADAMAAVRWLVVTQAGLSLANFDRHNGATAKSRAQTAKRVANHRSNADGNADDVTDALAREEKRREEQEKNKDKARALELPEGPKPEVIIGKALIAGGLNPTTFSTSNPWVIALAEQGATPQEVEDVTREAVKGGKGLAWIAAVVKGRRDDAAALALAAPVAASQTTASDAAAKTAAEQARAQAEYEAKRNDPEEQRKITALLAKRRPVKVAA